MDSCFCRNDNFFTVVSVGRDEETYSKYAEGIRVRIVSELEAAQAN